MILSRERSLASTGPRRDPVVVRVPDSVQRGRRRARVEADLAIAPAGGTTPASAGRGHRCCGTGAGWGTGAGGRPVRSLGDTHGPDGREVRAVRQPAWFFTFLTAVAHAASGV